ncbi:MAG: type II secretion system protein [Gammaproteobacteria bacterium]|jgi:prepilin-type N-terminal cleavage/methylation domain-containing protein
MHTQRGFTLLELILVIVIMALAAVPVLGQFTQVSGSLQANEAIQTAALLAQEQAEAVLADRRRLTYAAIPTGTTSTVLTGNYSAYTRTLTVNEPPAGSGCAVGATCKEVIVRVDHNGRQRAAVTFILVDY